MHRAQDFRKEKVGIKIMTIREFAKLCDVSPATASRFFSGRGSISEPVRLRIEQMAKKTPIKKPPRKKSREATLEPPKAAAVPTQTVQ